MVTIMHDFYERVIQLLDKRPDDEEFRRFIDDLGESPQIYLETPHSTEYALNASGLFLSYFEACKCFAYVLFKSPYRVDERSGGGSYTGNFPCGVLFGDNPLDVQRKLGLNSVKSLSSSVDVCDEYQMGDVLVSFFFAHATGELWKVAARYVPAWDLLRGKPKESTQDS